MKGNASKVAALGVLVATTAVGATGGAHAGQPPTREGHPPSSTPLVIGHRGAAGYRPEHTLASYELAARMGADYIEPDLVSTKDHVLVVSHDNNLLGTTDVADHPELASRKTTKIVDGATETGWFTEDLTLAELKTLRVKERIPDVRQENTMYNGRFRIPTFAEVLALRERLSRELHRSIGVYPETKRPTYFATIGLPLEPPLVQEIRHAHLDAPQAPIFVQSFELTNLVALRHHYKLKSPEVFLTSTTGAPYDLKSSGDPRIYADLLKPSGLAQLKKDGINGIGPDKSQVIPRKPDGSLGTPSPLVRQAHRAGLVVHPYTFRAENTFLPTDYRSDSNPADFGRSIDEDQAFMRAGVDGLFCDQADVCVEARKELQGPRS